MLMQQWKKSRGKKAISVFPTHVRAESALFGQKGLRVQCLYHVLEAALQGSGDEMKCFSNVIFAFHRLESVSRSL